MELTTDQRRALWAALMQELSAAGESVSIKKADLLAAVNAIDTWFDTNAATLNSALPTAARNALSPAQKARLLMFVVRARYIEGV